MYKLVLAPHHLLSTKLKPVKRIDTSLKKKVKEMEETLIAQVDPMGVGLAANQVGLDLALFIIKPSPKAPTEVIINPKILEVGNDSTNDSPYIDEDGADTPLEGCLSIPRIWSPVKRAKKIYLQYQNLRGEVKQKWFTGFKAIIVQHEMDHLNGLLFTQRALEQQSHVYEEKNGKLVERTL